MEEQIMEDVDDQTQAVLSSTNYITNYVTINFGRTLPAMLVLGLFCILAKEGMKRCSKKS